jgi:hypothetical protein
MHQRRFFIGQTSANFATKFINLLQFIKTSSTAPKAAPFYDLDHLEKAANAIPVGLKYETRWHC